MKSCAHKTGVKVTWNIVEDIWQRIYGVDVQKEKEGNAAIEGRTSHVPGRLKPTA